MSLTKAERDALPATDFAVPDKRVLPIHDARHTRLAWSQVSHTKNLSDAERGEARRLILARAHVLGIDTSGWESIHAMRIAAMALDLPDVSDHPNRMPFSGVLVKLDEPSDAAPHGSKGKRVVMSEAAARAALASLLGMAVDMTDGLDGHDPQQKIGIITGADIEGRDLTISGFIYAADFPEEAAAIQRDKNTLGFSFEAQQIFVENLDADPLVITSCVFTGAAILKKNKAAFTTTSLAAAAAGELDMDKEELKALLAETVAPVVTRLDALEASTAKLDEKIEAGKELHAKVAPFAEKLRACASGMQAAGVGMHATRGHVATLNRMADNMEAEAMAGSMPHIYRDHDWSPMYAGADEAGAAKPNAEVEALKAQVADLSTKLNDNIAAGRANANEPERKTLSPQITALLARADIAAPEEGKKLTIGAVDKILAAGSLSISERIRLKQELSRANLLDAA